jgi:MerR family transcriptional regulator, light-induced transcriptional regulator
MMYSPSMAPPTGYLRIGELARRTGTSPELLRAWEQRYGLLRPSRSSGGFRLYSDDDLARVRRTRGLIAEGLSAAEAAGRVLGMEAAGETVATPVIEDLTEELETALDEMDGEAADAALDRVLGALSLETALREVLLPYLRRLGDRWAAGEASVGQEHFASNLIRGRLFGLARDWWAGNGPAAVLACLPGEAHELGLLMFGLVLSRRGWRITYLGADTPIATVAETVVSRSPDLVVLAVFDGRILEEHAQEILEIAHRSRVVVGGHVQPEQVAAAGAMLLDADPIEAARAVAAG